MKCFLTLLLLPLTCFSQQIVKINVQKNSDGTNALTAPISIPIGQTFSGAGYFNLSGGTVALPGSITFGPYAINLGGNLTTGGSFTTSGANPVTLTTTGSTNVTIPKTGTLSTLAGAEVLSNKSIDAGQLTGTIAAGRLPAPTASTLGGVQSIVAVSHQWINSISTSGVPQQSQPAFSDVSGLASMAQQASNAVAITGGTITGMGSPSNPMDVANKNYVDTVATGLQIKPSAKEATTTTLPSNTYNNGAAGVGATLTANATGTLTIDGVVVALNDVVLVKNESAAANDGLYTCTTAGAGGAAYVLTRSTSMNSTNAFSAGYVFVSAGTANTFSGWVCTNVGSVTVGTTAINFTQFSGANNIVAGTGLGLSGNVLSIDSTVATLTGSQTLTNKSLTAPHLGTPTDGTLTNCTGLPLTSGVTGNLGVSHLNSGSGASSSSAWFGDSTWKTLAAVSQSGSYSDLSGTPSISTIGHSGNLDDLNSGAGLNLDVTSHGQAIQITTEGDTDNLMGFYSFNFGTFNGYIRVGSGATAYVSSSDQRLKTPLRHWSLGRKFDDIPFGEFNWLASGKLGHGTLAQELYKIYPDAVAVGTDKMVLNPRTGKMTLVKPWCVDYAAIITPTAIRVQEIDHELDSRPSTIEIRIFEALAIIALLLGIWANLRKK